MKLKIIAYSDNICPFCYVGSKRIDKLKEEIDFDIEWKGFEIHTDTPKEGIKIKDYFKSFDAESAKKHLEDFGKDVGIKLNNEKMSNSHLSLKANEFAKKEDKFDKWHNAVFKAYFEKGKDIGNEKVILDIAEKIGLDKNKLKKYLQSEEADKILKKNLEEGKKFGVKGVPTFIIGNKMIVGAQPYDVIKKVVLEVKNG